MLPWFMKRQCDFQLTRLCPESRDRALREPSPHTQPVSKAGPPGFPPSACVQGRATWVPTPACVQGKATWVPSRLCSGRGGGDRAPQHLCCPPGLQSGSEDWQTGPSQAGSLVPPAGPALGVQEAEPAAGRGAFGCCRGMLLPLCPLGGEISIRLDPRWGSRSHHLSRNSPKMESNQTSSFPPPRSRLGSGNPWVCAHGPWRRGQWSEEPPSPPPAPLCVET